MNKQQQKTPTLCRCFLRNEICFEDSSAEMVIDNLLVMAVDTSLFSTFSFIDTVCIIGIPLIIETRE